MPEKRRYIKVFRGYSVKSLYRLEALKNTKIGQKSKITEKQATFRRGQALYSFWGCLRQNVQKSPSKSCFRAKRNSLPYLAACLFKCISCLYVTVKHRYALLFSIFFALAELTFNAFFALTAIAVPCVYYGFYIGSPPTFVDSFTLITLETDKHKFPINFLIFQ